jgi:hypothetical protein
MMRFDNALLDQKKGMEHFIRLNNCDDPTGIEAAIRSEFEFPDMAAFYKANAATILAGVPTSISLNTGDATGEVYAIGEYDRERKVFPLAVRRTIAISSMGVRGSGPSGSRCNGTSYGGVFNHSVTFPEVRFDSFPVDEDNARKYVSFKATHIAPRLVTLKFDMEIVGMGPRRMDPMGDVVGPLQAKITKITIMDFDKRDPSPELGVLDLTSVGSSVPSAASASEVSRQPVSAANASVVGRPSPSPAGPTAGPPTGEVQTAGAPPPQTSPVSCQNGAGKIPVDQNWQNTETNRLYRLHFDCEHVVISDLESNQVVGDLAFNVDKRDSAKSKYVGNGPFSPCPEGRGKIELQVRSDTRIDGRVQTPNTQSNSCSGLMETKFPNMHQVLLLAQH